MASVWGYSQEIIDKIKEAIEKDDLGGGPSLVAYTPASRMYQLAERAAELFDVKYVIPVTSGTAALHSAYIAANICQGDEVIVPSFTFVSTANAFVSPTSPHLAASYGAAPGRHAWVCTDAIETTLPLPPVAMQLGLLLLPRPASVVALADCQQCAVAVENSLTCIGRRCSSLAPSCERCVNAESQTAAAAAAAGCRSTPGAFRTRRR